MWTGPDPAGTRYTTSSTRPNVTVRADSLGNPNVASPDQYGWYDVRAFAAPALGRFGTAGPGVAVGPGIRLMHNSLAKEFPIRERARVRFEILANTNLNSKFDTAVPRSVQFQMRVEW